MTNKLFEFVNHTLDKFQQLLHFTQIHLLNVVLVLNSKRQLKNDISR